MAAGVAGEHRIAPQDLQSVGGPAQDRDEAPEALLGGLALEPPFEPGDLELQGEGPLGRPAEPPHQGGEERGGDGLRIEEPRPVRREAPQGLQDARARASAISGRRSSRTPRSLRGAGRERRRGMGEGPRQELQPGRAPVRPPAQARGGSRRATRRKRSGVSPSRARRSAKSRVVEQVAPPGASGRPGAPRVPCARAQGPRRTPPRGGGPRVPRASERRTIPGRRRSRPSAVRRRSGNELGTRADLAARPLGLREFAATGTAGPA